jgi:hypothetical protein
MPLPELFVVVTRDRTAWVSTEPVEGVFPKTVVYPIRPGETVEDVPYKAWHSLLGETVDLETLQGEIRRGRMPEVAEEGSSGASAGAEPPEPLTELGWIIIVAAVVTVLFGVAGLVAQAQAFATYRPVDALIVGTSVESHVGRRRRQYYAPRVRYQYDVAGKQYEGSRFRWRPPSYRDSLKAVGMMREYQRGQRVTVYVDPSDVSKSFLRREAAKGLLWGPLAMLGLLGFNYWFLVARHWKRQTSRGP